MSATLKHARARYGKDLAHTAPIHDGAVLRAFTTVPRECFLGPAPWTVLTASGPRGDLVDNPALLYRNVLVVIDPTRGLNNGEPKLWARLFDRLAVRSGERVIHIGTGTGYYTAILAELVGPEGTVLGIEVEEDLAARTCENLAAWPQAKTQAGNGFEADLGKANVIVASAGVSHLPERWLDALQEGGRLLVPFTVHGEWPFPGEPARVWTGGWGAMLLVTRRGKSFAAEFVGEVGFYHCIGGRSAVAEAQLEAALLRGGQEAVRSLQLGTNPDASCWLEGDGWWLSTQALDQTK